jgi:hypothetical protein
MLTIRFFLIGFAVWFSAFSFFMMCVSEHVIACASLVISLALIVIDSIVSYLIPRMTTREHAQGEYSGKCNPLMSDPLYFQRSYFN